MSYLNTIKGFFEVTLYKETISSFKVQKIPLQLLPNFADFISSYISKSKITLNFTNFFDHFKIL
jgi:hypothetical protein